MTRYCPVKEFNTHEFPGRSLCLLPGQSILSDKLLLIKFHKHPQAGHDWSDIL